MLRFLSIVLWSQSRLWSMFKRFLLQASSSQRCWLYSVYKVLIMGPFKPQYVSNTLVTSPFVHEQGHVAWYSFHVYHITRIFNAVRGLLWAMAYEYSRYNANYFISAIIMISYCNYYCIIAGSKSEHDWSSYLTDFFQIRNIFEIREIFVIFSWRSH